MPVCVCTGVGVVPYLWRRGILAQQLHLVLDAVEPVVVVVEAFLGLGQLIVDVLLLGSQGSDPALVLAGGLVGVSLLAHTSQLRTTT